MDDPTVVDLGPVPLDHAKTLLLACEYALAGGAFWSRDNVIRATALKAMLTYRIAKAERASEWMESA